MGHDQTRQDSRVRGVDRVRLVVYPLLLVAVCVVAVVELGWIHVGARASASAMVQLRGLTDERQPISIGLSHTRQPRSMQTTLIGLCENGRTYQISWAPDSPRIPFRTSGGVVFVTETARHQEVGGPSSVTTAWTTIRLGGPVASGDARFRTVFHYPGGHTLRCDSGFVHWAVNRGGTAVAVSGPLGSYPPVASLAVNPPVAQVEFAHLVDATCAQIYNEDEPLRGHLTTSRPVSDLAAAHRDHTGQYLAIRRLGPAPVNNMLYQAWLSNMRQRVAREGDALRALVNGDSRRAAMIYDQVGYLKVEGDSLGQQFGLTLCTSNGQLRHTIGGP